MVQRFFVCFHHFWRNDSCQLVKTLRWFFAEVSYSSEYGAMDDALAIDIFGIIRDLTSLLELVKNVGKHAAVDLVLRYNEIVDSKEFKDLMARLPESWIQRINIIVEKVQAAIKTLGEFPIKSEESMDLTTIRRKRLVRYFR